MSLWLFDLGNTRLKAAPLGADGRIGPVQAWPHDDGGWDPSTLPSGEAAYLASVVPAPRRVQVLEALCSRFTRIERATTLPACGRLRIAYAQPQALGIDRFLAMLAATCLPQPALVVGVGTAMTLDLVDAEGQHRGGRIAPSPHLMRQALHARVPTLPQDGGGYAEFARQTDDALVSGCEGAAIALIERSLAQATALLGIAPLLWLHGGGAAALAPQLPVHHREDALVLQGLAQWAQAAARR